MQTYRPPNERIKEMQTNVFALQVGPKRRAICVLIMAILELAEKWTPNTTANALWYVTKRRRTEQNVSNDRICHLLASPTPGPLCDQTLRWRCSREEKYASN